ncbi:MAG TPA: hypothetical protein VE010_00410 [Thermoanaerobaculia bacterium]|nr:hypothetical protein [Thermoanaerobaculia bacterium]
MSLSIPPLAVVEVLDAGPRWSYGMLAANFARVQILMTWYGGNPDRYLAAIEDGIEDAEDREFVDALKRRVADDGGLLDDMRRIVGEFASRFAS